VHTWFKSQLEIYDWRWWMAGWKNNFVAEKDTSHFADRIFRRSTTLEHVYFNVYENRYQQVLIEW